MHEAAEGLQHRIHRRTVAHGAGFAVAGNRNVDQAGVHLRETLVAVTKSLGHAGAIAFDKHIGIGDHRVGDRFGIVMLEVQADRPLAHIGDDGIGGVVAVDPADQPRTIAALRLDLDDIRALLSHQHPAIGTGQTLREIDDLQALIGTLEAHDAPRFFSTSKTRVKSDCGGRVSSTRFQTSATRSPIMFDVPASCTNSL